ncbi:MAG: ATP-dependent zinc metalloprotease FtsH [Acidimicrobiia bacterium]
MTAASNGSDQPPAPSRQPSSSSEGNRHHGRSKPWRVEGMPEDHDEGEDGHRRPHWKEVLRRLWLPLILLLIVNWLIVSWLVGGGTTPRTTVSYSFFHQQVVAHNVSEVTTTGDSITGTFEHKVPYPAKSKSATKVTDFETERPAFSNDRLVQQLLDSGVKVTAEPPSTGSSWTAIVFAFAPTLLIIGLLVWFFRRGMAAAGAGLGGFGRSRARLYEPETSRRTTFEDVAGIDEVKAEVMEIVEFLRDPDRFRRLGAQIPRGVLLTGAPGTGKTLLARAVAGEAAVPFLSISASEFIEMIVGVGASRVRDLFEQAKKVAPSIIFIDELDAIGRARGGAINFSGHDEREQTLNQILTEMDGFTGNEGVVVLAATNRPEILDPALLRAGRFDRRIVVNPPDREGRRRILEVHTRDVPLAASVSLDRVASTTSGMVGAELKNLVNEAALLAARLHHEKVESADFADALERIVLGTARKIMISPEEKRRTAYHESGHALLGMLTTGADPVRKVSIIPRGQALGATLQTPEADRYGYSASYLRGRITGALGGRAAEELVFDDFTTGAEADLDIVTAIARQMVGRWGMSPAIGPVSMLPPPGQEQFVFDGNGPAPATREIVDVEVRRIIDECYTDAIETLRAHRENLDRLAERLLDAETLEEAEAYDAAGLPRAAHDQRDQVRSSVNHRPS